MSEPKFKIKEGTDGQLYFTLVARNGEVIATSEGYTTKAACINGIEAVKREASVAEIVDESQ